MDESIGADMQILWLLTSFIEVNVELWYGGRNTHFHVNIIVGFGS